jgi:GNAT superfamily N-acetyltransferase
MVLVGESESIVAFAASGAERTGREDYRGVLYAIYVLNRWQGRGIGKQLVRRTVDSLLASGTHSMLVWALAENVHRPFYEALGGKPLGQQEIEIGQQRIIEVAYGWDDLAASFSRSSG